MLSGLKAHRYRTQIVEVFEESSINLFLQPQHNRYGKIQRKAAVAESVTDGSKWFSLRRGGMQIDEIDIAASPADRISYGHQ